METVEFEPIINKIMGLSNKAQMTFMNRLISRMGPNRCRTIIRYCCMKLDNINSRLPKEDPGRIKHEGHRRRYEQLRKSSEEDLLLKIENKDFVEVKFPDFLY